MDREKPHAANMSKALKVGLPAVALGAGAIGVAAASGQSPQQQIVVQSPSTLQPTDIVMPPGNAKSRLTFVTRGLTATEKAALRKSIAVEAFTFGLGPAENSGTFSKQANLNVFNFEQTVGKDDAALKELMRSGQAVSGATLTAKSPGQTIDYVMTGLHVKSIATKGDTDIVSISVEKLTTSLTSSKSGTMVTSWTFSKAPPTTPTITTPFNITQNVPAAADSNG